MSDDNVNHPQHYGGDTTYEAIKVIEAWELGFCLGNTVKYISRAGKKDPAKELEDLKKAAWYLNRRIEQLGREAVLSDKVIAEAEPSTAFEVMHFSIGIDAEGVEWTRLRALHFPNVERAASWWCDFQDITPFGRCSAQFDSFDEGEITGIVATLTTPGGEQYAVRCVNDDPCGVRLAGWRRIDG